MPSTRQPPSLGVLASHVGYHLRLAQLAVFKKFESKLGEIDVSPAVFAVLEVLHRNEGISQSRLASLVALDSSSIVPLLDKLTRRGLVERRASTTDRRRNHIHLTEDGKALLNEAYVRAAENEKEVCKPLSASERKQLLNLLARLHDPSRAGA